MLLSFIVHNGTGYNFKSILITYEMIHFMINTQNYQINNENSKFSWR